MSSELEIMGMEGRIANYRQGRHTIKLKQCILDFPGINTRKEANRLVGRTVAWYSSTGKELKGRITRAHGNSGAVRALFKEKGLPGQALGEKITIIK